MRATSLDKFKQLVEKLFPGDSFEDREMRFEMIENINCIEVRLCYFQRLLVYYWQEWEKHELRGYHQNLKETEILETLKDRRSAYLTFDLAMKVE